MKDVRIPAVDPARYGFLSFAGCSRNLKTPQCKFQLSTDREWMPQIIGT